MNSPEPRRWQGVERRHLAVFAAVARARSFRAGAQQLGYSQPAVSQLVDQLERIVGTTLLQRRSGSARITLTAAGELLLEHATGILDSFAAAQADLDSDPEDRLRVGLPAALSPRLVPALLERAGPPVDVTEAASEAELASLVARGDVDVAIGEAPPPGPFDARRISQDHYMLVTPASWPLVDPRRRDPRDVLAGVPLVARGDPRARRIEQELRYRGIEPRHGASASSDAAALALVRAGIAAAVLPHSALDEWDPRVVAASLTGLVAPRTMCVYRHRDRQPEPRLASVIAAARAACSALTPESAVALTA